MRNFLCVKWKMIVQPPSFDEMSKRVVWISRTGRWRIQWGKLIFIWCVGLRVLMLSSTFSTHETSQILCQNAIRSWENQHSAAEQLWKDHICFCYEQWATTTHFTPPSIRQFFHQMVSKPTPNLWNVLKSKKQDFTISLSPIKKFSYAH